jgi:hypothetical protein
MYADTLPASRHFEALFADGRGEAGIYSVADGRAPTGIFEQDGSGDALDVFGPLVVFDGATGGLMIDHNGNVTIGGTLITTSKCASSCGSSNRIALYASSTASPVIEDAGEAQLQDGHATVRLNPEFAAAIDPVRPYIVTVTAEGENDGLYVASRASSSFTVRESHGGHSAIPFAYRITARPYGMSSTAQIHQISMPVQQVTVLRPHPLQ